MIKEPIEYLSLERLVNAVVVEKFPTWDHYMQNVRDLERALEELKYLRFFFDKADIAFGPGSNDVYEAIQIAYVKEGGKLPENHEQR